MKLCWMAAIVALCGLGTTAEDYYNRSLHADTEQERLELLDRALEINPEHVPSLRHRGLVRLALGQEKEALADVASAAELSPDDAAINYTASWLAIKLKDRQQQIRFLDRAVKAEPASWLLRREIVSALAKAGRAEDALGHAELLVERCPQNDFAYMARAEVYQWLDRYTDAAADLTVLVQRHPKDARYYLSRCGFLRDAGDFKQALADVERAMESEGEAYFVLAARGCCYEGLGELDKALADFTRAAALDETPEYLWIWSCIIMRKQGKLEQSARQAKEFLNQFKSDKWVAPVLKYLAGEMEEEEVFRLARHEEPETNRQQLCEAYYYVGACHLAAKRLDRAEELFRKTLEQRVNDFYEHGFALRDLRVIQNLRKEATPDEKKE